MNNNKFDALFKKVSIKPHKRSSSVAPDAIRLLRSATDGPLNRFTVSKELSKLLPWSENEKLDLYWASENLFAVAPDINGSLILKLCKSKNSKSFQIYNRELCKTLNTIANAIEFSGWVEGDKLFFKTK